MHHEIETIAALRAHLAEHGNLRNIVVQGVDLGEHSELVIGADVSGAVFLGGNLAGAARVHVQDGGGLLFPRLPDLPYRTYRARLYDADELMDGYQRGRPESHAACLDQRIYLHYDALRKQDGPIPILATLAQRLHDHAIDDALTDLLTGDRPRRVVAVMGGHAMKRTDAGYRKVARIAQLITQRDPAYLMATGGGPGAMEAATLGGWLANYDDAVLDDALAILARAPDYKHPEWLDTALEVRDKYPDSCDSLGIPTWFYGHEPPNLFATHIAKYFSNSLREDGLLAIAHHGVIYAPGSAGTIQEIFMDAAQNHYGVFADVSPMVFLDRHYWSETKPIYPLLRDLAAGRQYQQLLTIADDVDEIVDFIVTHPPIPYQG